MNVESRRSKEMPPKPDDGVAEFLALIGWIVVSISLAAGLILCLIALASALDTSSYDSGGPSLILVLTVTIAGPIQGLLLVGFSRIIRYLSETAANAAESTRLLHIAVKSSK